MIQLKNAEQIALMREAGRITGEALCLAGEAVKEGISTFELDKIIRTHILQCGAKPSFLHYNGFPASACISINDQVIHGIPSKNRFLQEGDIVKIDVGAFYRGYHGDSANTFAVGRISAQAQKLIEVTKTCFWQGVGAIKSGARLGDIGAAVQQHAESNGFSVVRRYVGHGVGRALHEDPSVPNYGTAGRGVRLYPGLTIAIEPMVNVGTHEVKELDDGWTVLTLDGSLSAHYEHTVAITDNGVEVLTKVN